VLPSWWCRRCHGHEQVYASQSSRDEVETAGRFGSGRSDPEDSSFGAITYSSDGGKAADGTSYASVNGHGYFDSGTESLQNIAVVSTGQGTLLSGLKPQLF
jgi:hypothetical protein